MIQQAMFGDAYLVTENHRYSHHSHATSCSWFQGGLGLRWCCHWPSDCEGHRASVVLKAGWLRNVEPATGRLPGKEFHQICYDLFLSEIRSSLMFFTGIQRLSSRKIDVN